MQTVQQTLVLFFEQVARKEEALLKKLEEQRCFELDETRWSFSLPDLHQFLQTHDAVFAAIEYRQFRQLIFNSPIHQSVKAHGAMIDIISNKTKVDRTRYALVWERR